MNHEASDSSTTRVVKLLTFWQEGFFGLLGFTLQMIMILVFGYSLAVFSPINRVLTRIGSLPRNLIDGTFLTASITLIAGILNWGFGLIIGAIMARITHESLVSKGVNSNSALLATAGYLGMAIWHGGFSASAPLTVAGNGHFLEGTIGLIPVNETLFTFWFVDVEGDAFAPKSHENVVLAGPSVIPVKSRELFKTQTESWVLNETLNSLFTLTTI